MHPPTQARPHSRTRSCLPGAKCFHPFATQLNPPGRCRGRGLCPPRTLVGTHRLGPPMPPVRDAEQMGWSRTEVPKSGGAQLPPPEPPQPRHKLCSHVSACPHPRPIPTPDLSPSTVQHAPALPDLRAGAANAKEFDPKNPSVPSLPLVSPQLRMNGHCQDFVPGSPGAGARHRGVLRRGQVALGWHRALGGGRLGRARGAGGVLYPVMAEGTASVHTPRALPAVRQLWSSLHHAKRSPQADPLLVVTSVSFH